MNVGSARQPFYYCLPDETDSVRLFGGGAWAWFCVLSFIYMICLQFILY